MGKVRGRGQKRLNGRKIVVGTKSMAQQTAARIEAIKIPEAAAQKYVVADKKALQAMLTCRAGLPLMLGLANTATAKEQKHGALRPAHRLRIPDRIPEEARQAIEAMWERPSTSENDRVVLRRFATSRLIYTDVWKKLPREPEWLAGWVILWAIFALKIFPLLRPLPRSDKRADWRRWAKHVSDHPGWMHFADGRTPLDSYAWMANQLRNMLDATSDETWSRHWPGDPAMKNRASAARFFLDAANCLQSIRAESFFSNLRLPPVARWDDPQAPQRFFGQFMSGKMKELCGRPCDVVVAALTAVAFHLDDLGPKKVREWRRMQVVK